MEGEELQRKGNNGGRKEWESVTIKSCLLQMREKVRSQLGKRRPL